MPNLYEFDDYDRCLQEFSKSRETYCFVRAEVLPQNNSEAWHAIAEISKYNKHHFDHRHLYFGLCLRWCKDDLAEAGVDVVKELYTGLLTNNTKVRRYVCMYVFTCITAKGMILIINITCFIIYHWRFLTAGAIFGRTFLPNQCFSNKWTFLSHFFQFFFLKAWFFFFLTGYLLYWQRHR